MNICMTLLSFQGQIGIEMDNFGGESLHEFSLSWVLVCLQFAVLMWVFTYVGALFNGLTLLILGKSTERLRSTYRNFGRNYAIVRKKTKFEVVRSLSSS